MPKPTGSPKTGGRKRGTPNHRSLELVDQLEAIGLNVPAEIAKTLPELDAKDRADLLIEIMSFLFPKRKAIEMVGQIPSVPEPKPEDTPEDIATIKLRLINNFRKMLVTDGKFARAVLEPMCPTIKRQLLEGKYREG